MERRGFIQDMMDVKVLVLYVAARVDVPVTVQEIYELCLQDDKLTYFDVCDAVPDLVRSGHLQELPNRTYQITDKGRENGAATEDSIAYPVKERAKADVEKFNQTCKKKGLVEAEIIPAEQGDYIARLILNDPNGRLMTLELTAPNQPQAAAICRSFLENGPTVYSLLMADLLENQSDFDT